MPWEISQGIKTSISPLFMSGDTWKGHRCFALTDLESRTVDFYPPEEETSERLSEITTRIRFGNLWYYLDYPYEKVSLCSHIFSLHPYLSFCLLCLCSLLALCDERVIVTTQKRNLLSLTFFFAYNRELILTCVAFILQTTLVVLWGQF